MREYSRTLGLFLFTDDDVNQSNGITLDPVERDENGFVPVINYQPSEEDTRKREELAVIAADILRNAGARTIIRSNWKPEIYIHIISTMRMGFVIDTDCEAYQVKRLFVADNSAFLMVLADRIRHLPHKRWPQEQQKR